MLFKLTVLPFRVRAGLPIAARLGYQRSCQRRVNHPDSTNPSYYMQPRAVPFASWSSRTHIASCTPTRRNSFAPFPPIICSTAVTLGS